VERAVSILFGVHCPHGRIRYSILRAFEGHRSVVGCQQVHQKVAQPQLRTEQRADGLSLQDTIQRWNRKHL